MHFRRYALVAAGMLATCFIITAPGSGATLQDDQEGRITISIVVPESNIAPAVPLPPRPKKEPAPAAVPPSPAKKTAEIPRSIPMMTSTEVVVLVPKERQIDAAPDKQESATSEPTASVADSSPEPVVVSAEPSDEVSTPTPSPTATVGAG